MQAVFSELYLTSNDVEITFGTDSGILLNPESARAVSLTGETGSRFTLPPGVELYALGNVGDDKVLLNNQGVMRTAANYIAVSAPLRLDPPGDGSDVENIGMRNTGLISGLYLMMHRPVPP